MDKYEKMRRCSYLLPDPGGEVVRELLDEIAALKDLVTYWREETTRQQAEIAALKARIADLERKLELSDAHQGGEGSR